MTPEQSDAWKQLSDAVERVIETGFNMLAIDAQNRYLALLESGAYRLRLTIEPQLAYVDIAIVSHDASQRETMVTIREEGH